MSDPVLDAELLAGALRRKIGWTLFATHLIPALGVAFFLAGGIVLIRRLWFAAPYGVFAGLAGGVGIVGAVLYACWRIRNRVPPVGRLVVWLDSLGGSGGLLAASRECPVNAWAHRIQLPAAPAIRLRRRQLWIPLAAGILFLAGTVLTPVNEARKSETRKLDISQESSELEEKLEVLSEESLLTPKLLEELQENMRELENRNDAGDAGRTYELLDALNRKLDGIGEDAAARARENLQAVDMLGNIAENLASSPSSQQLIAAQNEFGELMSQLAAGNPEIAELLRKAAADARKCAGQGGDPEAMRNMAAAMRANAGMWRDRIARMQNAKLLKQNCLKPGSCGGKDGECNSGCFSQASLDAWLAANAAGADALAAVAGECPGSGGVSRGRGDAALELSGNTADDAGRREELGVATALNPGQSTVLDRFSTAPVNAERERKGAAAGSLRGGDTVVEQRERVIFPAHRKAVERYFQK